MVQQYTSNVLFLFLVRSTFRHEFLILINIHRHIGIKPDKKTMSLPIGSSRILNALNKTYPNLKENHYILTEVRIVIPILQLKQVYSNHFFASKYGEK